MSLFLYKPHVYGPEGVTTPDVIIDRARGVGAHVAPWPATSALSSDTYVDVAAGTQVSPSLAYVAAGAGTLVCPAAVLSDGRIILARMAWRYHRLGAHRPRLSWPGASAALSSDEANALPRGDALVLCSDAALAADSAKPLAIALTCESQPDLAFTLHCQDAGGEKALKTKPRYSVGPQHGEVKHYV